MLVHSGYWLYTRIVQRTNKERGIRNVYACTKRKLWKIHERTFRFVSFQFDGAKPDFSTSPWNYVNCLRNAPTNTNESLSNPWTGDLQIIENDVISIRVNRIECIQIIESKEMSVFFQIHMYFRDTKKERISEYYYRRKNEQIEAKIKYADIQMNGVGLNAWSESKNPYESQQEYDARRTKRRSNKEDDGDRRIGSKNAKTFQYMKYFASFDMALGVCWANTEYQRFYPVFYY